MSKWLSSLWASIDGSYLTNKEEIAEVLGAEIVETELDLFGGILYGLNYLRENKVPKTIYIGKEPVKYVRFDLFEELLSTLKELKEVCRTVPCMQEDKYTDIGIKTINIINKAEKL